MNRVYRLVWSRVRNAWVAVSENAKGQGKSGCGKSALRRKAIVTALALALAPLAHANPTGGQLVSGAGSIAQSGAITTINQTSQNLSLNWQSFNIAPAETVNFLQPSAAALAVNRIADTNGSQILGHLNANGQVWLINPNGVLFGQGAQVNVGGLVASTLDFSDANLNGNSLSFGGNGAGSIINQGTLNAANGGYVALLGNHVGNQGAITARLGTVALGAGSAATLTFSGNSLLHMQVDQSTLNNLAENGGLLQADGGQVIMSAGARNSLLASVVNNSGVIEARTVENHAGTITLLGGMTAGSVNVGGTLDASAPNGGNGGFIETSAARVKIADDAYVTTAAAACTEPCRSGLAGTWLIDPVDLTIAASGGNITGATLSTQLGMGNVSIVSSSTAGNINVNDIVTWSAHQLTLTSNNNIYINANLNGSGSASLALEYGQGAVAAGNTSHYFFNNGAHVNLPAGNNFSTLLGSDGAAIPYTVITNLGVAGDATTAPSTITLQGMAASSTTLADNYVLGADIVATATGGWNAGAGFLPVGDSVTKFTGAFDGLGHTISNLTINRPATDNLGLFGVTDTGAVIRNVGLLGGNVSGTGSNNVGGLVGYNSGTVSFSYTSGSVSGAGNNVGGLAGYNSGTVSNSYAAGSVSGTGSNNVGGLAGYNLGTVGTSYATSNVSGTGTNVGGLVGNNDALGTVSNSYATGTVGGSNNVGGMAGYNYGTVESSYATGSVSGSSNLGGLAGTNDTGGIISNSYWNSSVNTTGIGTDNNSSVTTASGLGTAAMQLQSNFTPQGTADGEWDFTGIWVMYDGHTNPLLRSFLTPLTLTANNDSKTYNKSAYSGGNGVTYSLSPDSSLLGTVSYGGTSQGAVNVNSYTITPGGLYSYSQHGYLINYADGSLTVNPAPVSVTGTMVSNKVYDGNTAATLGSGTLSGVYSGDTVTLTQAGVFASKNVGTGNGVTATDSLGGIDAGNYTIVQPGGLAANITPKTITVAASGVNKEYNGTLSDAATLASTGVVSGDVVNFADASATFGDKNVGTGKTVTVTGITAGGADAGNYTLSNTSVTTSANITAKSISVTARGVNKVYDGLLSDAATLSSPGIISGDTVTFTDTATFADKNIGTGKTVSVSGIAASGADSGNYTLANTTASTSANITPKTITVAASSGNMVYSGSATDTASVTLSITGAVSGDDVNVAEALATFANKNAGTGKSVSVSGISKSGADAGNYTLAATTAKTTADITPLAITVSATGTDMIYNGKLKDAVTLTGTGVIAGDVVKFTDTSATFADPNAGTGKTVTVTGIKDSGLDAKNYTFNTTATTTANITPKTITVSAKGSNKVYDGTINDTVTLAAKGVLRGDIVTLSDTSATFADKSAANGKTVTVSGISLGGADAGNYTLGGTTALTMAKITKLTITVTATGTDKTYDGNVNDLVALASAGIISGDVVNFADTSATFANKNAGTGKTVTVKGITASGADAGNYKLSKTTATTSANITP